MKHRESRDFWQQALAGSAECPPFAAFDAPSEVVRAHLESCERCRAEFALLREFQRLTPQPEEEAGVEWVVERYRWTGPVDPEPWWRRFFLGSPAPQWMVTVLVLLLLFAGAWKLRQMRDQSVEAAARARAVVNGLSPAGDLREAPGAFRWEPAPGAARYRVTVTEAGGAAVSTLEVPGATAEADGAARAAMAEHKTLSWRVAALGANGEILAESQSARFRVLP